MSNDVSIPLTVSADGQSSLHELGKMIQGWRKDNKSVPHAPVGDTDQWRQLTSAGWHRFGITIDGENPTSGCDLLALSELCGRELLALPLVATVGALRWLHRSDPPAAGRWEPLQAASLALPASGHRMVVPFAANACALIPTPEAIGQPADLGAYADHDDYASTFPLAFVRVSGHASVSALANPGVREVALMHSATTVGCAARCLERSVEYSRERKAYGAQIGSFQAVRHMMADMYRDVELIRSGLVGALIENDWIALALHCTAVAQRVVAQSIQIHGGIGFTWDAGLHFHARHIMAVRKMLMRLNEAALQAQEITHAA
jgi:hypothetical protein